MLLIPCPYCGDRPEIEFSYGGEAHVIRAENPAVLDDQQWSEFLYMRKNPKGPHSERWRHVHGCGRFLNVVRDTTNDNIIASYPIGATKADPKDLRLKSRG
jgi:sarcosine oxidase subunit delta